jgi:hypothetical protein
MIVCFTITIGPIIASIIIFRSLFFLCVMFFVMLYFSNLITYAVFKFLHYVCEKSTSHH